MAAKDKKHNIDWLNHFVGLISVLLGVLIAFGLNSWNESRKEDRVIQTVLVNIQDEMENNLRELDSTYLANKNLRDFLVELLKVVDDKMDPVKPADSLIGFRQKYADYISDDLESISILIELFELSDVAWTHSRAHECTFFYGL